MASVANLLTNIKDFSKELQDSNDKAHISIHKKTEAVFLHQKCTRGHLIRRHFYFLHRCALVIQCAWRKHAAEKAYRLALLGKVIWKMETGYNRAATMFQALWRGYMSRKNNFNYRLYRQWLSEVTSKGDRLVAATSEFRALTQASNLRMLEEEARKWLAFVVFKLHHLLRTQSCSGIFSEQSSTELSEFEKLLKSIRYTEYMKNLRRKYEEFVRKYKPKFNNKVLLPIIGDGHDYWYLSLPEMYELAAVKKSKEVTRHKPFHHGPQHKEPFLWRKFKPPVDEKRGPFTPRKEFVTARTPKDKGVDEQKDPRFHLYVKHYRPRPDLMDYVDYHVNILLARRFDIIDRMCDMKDKSMKKIVSCTNVA